MSIQTSHNKGTKQSSNAVGGSQEVVSDGAMGDDEVQNTMSPNNVPAPEAGKHVFDQAPDQKRADKTTKSEYKVPVEDWFGNHRFRRSWNNDVNTRKLLCFTNSHNNFFESLRQPQVHLSDRRFSEDLIDRGRNNHLLFAPAAFFIPTRTNTDVIDRIHHSMNTVITGCEYGKKFDE